MVTMNWNLLHAVCSDQSLLYVFIVHLTLLDHVIAVEICVSVHLSIKRIHPDKMK